MPSEPETEGVPPAPSIWRLVRLLFMQPLSLRRMYQAWGLRPGASLIKLWRLAEAPDPVLRALAVRYTFLLLVLVPLSAALIAGVLTLSGVPVQPYVVVIGVVSGFAFGIAVRVEFGVTFVVAFIVAFIIATIVAAGMEVSVAAGVTCVVAFVVAIAAAFVMADGVAEGVVSGAASGVADILASEADEERYVVTLVVWFGVIVGVVVGAVAALEAGAIEVGLAVIVAFGAAISVVVVRLPIWLVEALLMQLLAWRMRRRPDTAGRLAAWLPFRHHDFIYAPLPGLRTCLIQIAEIDATLGKELIVLAAASPAQRRIARFALIELQARDLERAGRGKLFARAAGLDFPFLPKKADLASQPGNAPFRCFQIAAQDLIAGSTNQRQRFLALERARTALEGFHLATIGDGRPTPLARRLVPTASLWLGIIRDEGNKLTRKMLAHPEVPSAFIAGPPLTPDRAGERTLFKGRGDIIKLIEHDLAPDRRGVVLVVGQRRMGKTSLCNYLATYLGTGTVVVVSNFQPLSGDAHRETPHLRVLGDIASHLAGMLTPPESVRWGEGLRWLKNLDRTCSERKILVVIDEIERVEDGIRDGWCSTDFLAFLRAAGDALRHIRFLLLAAYPLHRLGPHWTDCLVSVTTRTISYLGEIDARELLTQPIPDFPDIYPQGGVDLILAQTGRHPYLLQKAGDDLCRLLNSRGGLRRATLDELTEVFDGMIRDVQVFDEIWRSRTEAEQATLQRLARSDEPGDLDPAALQLAREDYLVRRGDKAAIAVPLFREWIRMNVM